ncbi:hypothetical protein JKA74_05065 [Marivirga sp. S37H4]|uniref:Alpha-2-macroglobulin n=1 Tax=Marivirga aurantiaca TaxID=2802615 RepID=A0A934WWJ4_9BACT|nr:MG2 domain-containing protein [Marivirga aurantiaca]MBK6264398.1 hypothetical protein [Marivirga aurantiaca]
MMKYISTACTFILFLFISACSDSNENKVDSTLGPYSDYVKSISSGIISKQDPFVVNLNTDVSNIQPNQEFSSGAYTISPSVKAKAFWKSPSSIVIQPIEKLESNQEYKVTLKLDKIMEVPKELSEFTFSVKTIPLSYAVELGKLVNTDETDFSKVAFSGNVNTSDWVNNEEVEKMLQASYEDKALKIEWKHEENAKNHAFVIRDIVRAKADQNLSISWDGSPIKVEEKGSAVIEIPSVDSFKIMSANVEREGEAYISVIFSDPLLSNQNFADFVQVKGYESRYSAINNELKVYGNKGAFSGDLELKIFKNLRNSKGLGLDKEKSFSLKVSTFKPQVKILAGEGVILPSSNELILPIEVVGLKALEVTVIRIYPNNISQYFQDNEMGGTYNLREVGRPVVKKIIPLVNAGITDYYSWSQISLDLKEIFEMQKGAFYKVELDFNKDMAVYNCKGMDAAASIEEYAHDSRTLDWDYNYDSYYGDYNWNERDNPCHDMYYYQNRTASKMLFASDIGITAKQTENNKIHLLTTNIVNSEAFADVNIKVYDYQNQLISEGKTNAEGMLELDQYRKAFMAVAEKDGQFGYLKMQDGNALSLSNFDVSGATAKDGLKGFIYGERGVWRPGDTLHLGFILEDTYNTIPKGQKVVMELYNPQGQLYKSYQPLKIAGPVYSFKPSTQTESPTGSWLCKVRAGSAEFSKIIKIETIKPNRLKIDLDFEKEILKKSEGNYADLSVRWMHGAVAMNLKAEFEMSVRPTATKFKDYFGYNFDDPAKEFYAESKMIFDNRIDNNGNARFPVNIKNETQPPGMLKLAFNGKVFEEGGDFSIHSSSVLYSPYSSYAGISVPTVEENSSNPVLYTNKDNTIKLVNLDEDGQLLSGKNVTMELYKLSWRWWWDYGRDNISNYVSSSYNKPVRTHNVQLTNGKVDYPLTISDNDWGRYFIRVIDKASGHSTGQVVYFRRSDWYGTMAKAMGGANLLSFSLNKEEAKSGETIEVTIPSSGTGHAYITLETGKALIKKDYISMNGKETIYHFDLTEEMAPNVYVHVSLIQPHEQNYNDLPLRLYGVRNIMVENANTKLLPEIKAPENAQPGENVKLQIGEQNGKSMTYTIALVDEGLLGLTNYKTPQPWDHFYAREALGVRTYDMFEDVLGSFSGKYGRLLAVGGDEMGPMEEKSESRFKPVVKYMGPFKLEKGKTANHQFTVPQYIGELRMMVVAADASGKYGAAETSIGINQPLMILATLPRVMGPGETTLMPVTLFARDKNLTSAQLEVNTSGKLKVKGNKQLTVQLNPGKETIAYVEITAEQALGAGKVQIKAKSGKNEAVYDVNMQVRPSNPMMLSVADKLLDDKAEWKADYKPLGMLGTNNAVLELSTLPPLNLEQRTSYLIRYPHGCVEQTTSSVFAQLYLGDLVNLDEHAKYQIQTNIDAAIGRLRNFQIPSGGFAYWPGSQTANEWGTNYAGHFLIAAQKAGYSVPDDILRNFKKFQTGLANSWNGNTTYRSDVIQAYRLYTMSLAKAPIMAAMNRMRENSSISEMSRWLLANAYAEAGHADVGEELISNLSRTVDDYRELSYTFGSSVRDEAIIMETLVKLGRKNDAFEMLSRLAKSLGNPDYWMSTQTTAYCLIAVAEYTKGFPSSANLQADVTVNAEKAILNIEGYFSQIHLNEPDKNANITAVNKSGGPLYARLIRQGIPIEGGELAAQKNLGIKVNYYDRDGAVLDVASIKQGTDFKAVVTVNNPGTRGVLKELALTQIFPSGWEILNTRLNDEEGVSNSDKATYKDIRDDRVLTYFDLKVGEKKQFTVLLNASYKGDYYLPAMQAEAMYDNSIYAALDGQWVKVVD